MVWTTRYLGILTYSGIASLLIVQNVVTTTEHALAILAPIAAFIVADQYKHRNDDSYEA